MKKIIIIIVVAGISVLMFQKCKPTVDTAKEFLIIDSMSNIQLTMFRDSLKMNCNDSIMVWARHKADSMWAAALKAGKPKPKPVTVPTTTTVVTTTTGDDKKDKMSNADSASTQDKKDKMSNADSASTEKKKDKMKPK